jgi:hypothetical protein
VKTSLVAHLLDSRHVDRALKDRVQAYYLYVWALQAGVSDAEVLSKMPAHLRVSLLAALTRTTMHTLPVFRGCESGFVGSIKHVASANNCLPYFCYGTLTLHSSLSSSLYQLNTVTAKFRLAQFSEGDYIVRAQEKSEFCYFIYRGDVSCMDNETGNVTSIIGEGEWYVVQRHVTTPFRLAPYVVQRHVTPFRVAPYVVQRHVTPFCVAPERVHESHDHWQCNTAALGSRT